MTVQRRSKACSHCNQPFTERASDSNAQWLSRNYCGYLCLNRAKDHTPPPLDVRFWQRVDRHGKDECWPWKGMVNQRGRARLLEHGKLVIASHVAWFLHHGRWPASQQVVRHSCDNPGCLNPGHLLLGTQADNVADMMNRGRHRPVFGEKHPRAKLTDENVRVIRVLLADGEPKLRIASRFGISRHAIQRIAWGRGWRHVI